MNNNIELASTYRLTAVDFWMSAEVLYEHFKQQNESLIGNVRALPFYYLVTHASELLLKCALLKRGVSPPNTHDLLKLVMDLEDKGTALTQQSKKLLCNLSYQHKKHYLRYTALLDDGKAVFTPDPSQVFETLEELLMITRLRKSRHAHA